MFTQLCDGSGCAARWQRVESDSQRAVAGVDVATAGEGLTDQSVGFVVCAGVPRVDPDRAGQGGGGVERDQGTHQLNLLLSIMRAAGATGVATAATATTQFDRDPPAVSGALASVRVRFEVDSASGSLVCGPNARLIPNETSFGTNSAQRFRGTNGWAEVTLNHGWTAETGGQQRSGSTSWEADDVDAQVGYYSDFWLPCPIRGSFRGLSAG